MRNDSTELEPGEATQPIVPAACFSTSGIHPNEIGKGTDGLGVPDCDGAGAILWAMTAWFLCFCFGAWEICRRWF